MFELMVREEKAKVKAKERTETKFIFGKEKWNDLTENKTKQNPTLLPLFNCLEVKDGLLI